MRRVYFNQDTVASAYGLKAKRGPYATTYFENGDKISNSSAREINETISTNRFYYDVGTQKFFGTGGSDTGYRSTVITRLARHMRTNVLRQTPKK